VGNPGRAPEPSAPGGVRRVRDPAGFIALFIFIVNIATR
jgi:hypothetical protein